MRQAVVALTRPLTFSEIRLPASFAPVTELDETTASLPVSDEAGDLRTFLLLQLQALPFELRAPLVLRDHEGLSNGEVAEALGLTLGATKSRIHRARMQVRAALDESAGRRRRRRIRASFTAIR